jgi:aryl-alcohol dehydrogenase-like predicted oxidoreductase
METRRLGRLGHRSSVIIYGAAALAEVTQDEADRSIQQALDGGINHIDVAAGYGEAELRLGPWMPQISDRIFLATKTGERDRDAAWAQINASLERLRVDHVDLLQLHAVGDIAALDKVTRDGGALQAAVRAHDEGLVGAVGITGHGPTASATHLEALRRFPFATVITPLNAALGADPAFRDTFGALVREIQSQDAALMTIKTVARRNWPGVDAGAEVAGQRYATWYEPLDEPELVRAAVSWVLAHDEVTGLASPGDTRLLGMVLDAEANRMPTARAEQVLAAVAGYSSPFLRMPA